MPLSKFLLPGRTHQPEIEIKSNLRFQLPKKFRKNPNLSTHTFISFPSKRRNIDLGKFLSSSGAHTTYNTEIPVKVDVFKSKQSRRVLLGGEFESYNLIHSFSYVNGVDNVDIDLRKLKKARKNPSGDDFNFENLQQTGTQITVKEVRKLAFKGSINSDSFSLRHSVESPFAKVRSNSINISSGAGNDNIELNTFAKRAKIDLGEGDDDLIITGGVNRLIVKGGPGDDNVTWSNILGARKAIFDLGEGTVSITIDPINGIVPKTLIIKLGNGGTERVKIKGVPGGSTGICNSSINIIKPGNRRRDNYAYVLISDRNTTYVRDPNKENDEGFVDPYTKGKCPYRNFLSFNGKSFNDIPMQVLTYDGEEYPPDWKLEYTNSPIFAEMYFYRGL